MTSVSNNAANVAKWQQRLDSSLGYGGKCYGKKEGSPECKNIKAETKNAYKAYYQKEIVGQPTDAKKSAQATKEYNLLFKQGNESKCVGEGTPEKFKPQCDVVEDFFTRWAKKDQQ